MVEDSLLNLPEILDIRTEESIYEELSTRIQSSRTRSSDDKNQSDSQKGLAPKSPCNGLFNGTTGLLDLDKYIRRQAELAAKQKQNPTNPTKSVYQQKKNKKNNNNGNSRISASTKTGGLDPLEEHSLHEHQRPPGFSEDNNFISRGNDETSMLVDVCKKRLRNPLPSDTDSEYIPSSDESVSSEYLPRPAKRKKRQKQYLDDGDEIQYRNRLSKLPANWLDSSGIPLRTISNLFKLPKFLWKRLYPYQKVSVHWLWELHNRNLGGLLGDEMGLGKTVQIIAFLAALDSSELLSDSDRFRGLGPTLIICPATLLEQWVSHFHKWYPLIRVAILHQSGNYQGSASTLLESLKSGGVLLTSYSGVINNSDLLIPYSWHYVILDEGHKIRNPSAKITKLVKKINTPHRLLLTGSPMQNSLKELWSLFDFILPGKLGTLDAFMEHCATPIIRGGYSNASSLQEETARQIATMLKEIITPYMLRRTKSDVQSHLNLPQKNEQVLFCSLTREQRSIYKKYLVSENIKRILHERASSNRGQRAAILVALTALRKICNHPDLFTYSDTEIASEESENEEECDLNDENVAIERFGHWKKSGKMIVVRSLLKIWKQQGHRVLIFTQGKRMMLILEALIQREDYTYIRLDGSTPMSERQRNITLFNSNQSYFIFVSTTRVGGLGVNLTGANRVIIYDPDWNPATDVQARERAWRIGQNQNVTIYRLICVGTIEEKIYHRQIFKLLLSNKVLDDQKQRRMFRNSDLSELFHLNEPVNGDSTESDRLFRNSVIKKNLKISKGDNKSSEDSAMFEGERVSHLVGKRWDNSEETTARGNVVDDDNYVLNKLFAKNCVNSAIVHDAVLDTAKVEGHMTTPMHRLAKEAARESMDSIRQSRKWYSKSL